MNQGVKIFVGVALATGLVAAAMASERPDPAAPGFYGGVSLRDRGTDSAGVGFSAPASVWNRYSTPVADDTAPRALIFGGYRLRNDLALEAAITSVDQYALRPASGTRRGGGLDLASGFGGGDLQARNWNLDVFTTWTFYRTFALYGRLGYAQSESLAPVGATTLASADRTRVRDGVNYGVGLRYDMNPALGLRLEYGRFGRFAGESGPAPVDTDQVSFGVQYRF